MAYWGREGVDCGGATSGRYVHGEETAHDARSITIRKTVCRDIDDVRRHGHGDTPTTTTQRAAHTKRGAACAGGTHRHGDVPTHGQTGDSQMRFSGATRSTTSRGKRRFSGATRSRGTQPRSLLHSRLQAEPCRGVVPQPHGAWRCSESVDVLLVSHHRATRATTACSAARDASRQ